MVTNQLKEFISGTLLHNPAYPLRDDEQLIRGGLIDSFALVQLSVFIEDAFDVRLPDTEFTIDVMDTLNGIVDCVMRYIEARKEG